MKSKFSEIHVEVLVAPQLIALFWAWPNSNCAGAINQENTVSPEIV